MSGAPTTGMTEAYDWRGRTMIGSDGEKIGAIDEIYVDADSGQPEWGLVNTGLFGTKSHFVPLAGAQPSGEDVQVQHTKDRVTDAPSIDADGELSDEEERALYEHYGLEFGTWERPAEDTDVEVRAGDSTDDAMTRSEEELAVGKRSVERGRARLRKYVVTEQVQTTVPVQREEVRIEREPITDANVDDATSGPEISEDEHEVVLHEEEVVTEKRTVPKERVKLSKDTVTGEETVSEEVRKEQIETDGEVEQR